MKLKKILASVFASLFAVTSVAALTSCDDDEPAPTPDQGDTGNDEATPTDAEIVQAALDALKVESTVSADFTLTTKGNGNVAISWASDTTDVISVSEGNATVYRQLGEDKTVKLTATAVLNNATKTKEFTVTVTKIADESISIADIKAKTDTKSYYARGVVSGFVWGVSGTDQVKKGFYLTDSTGTIYVYDGDEAATLDQGDEIYIQAQRATYSSQTSKYDKAPQLSNVTKCTVLGKGKTPDFTAVVKDKTIAQINDAMVGEKRDNSVVGQVYELTGILSYQDEGYAYCIKDLEDSTKSLNVYFASMISTPGAYDKYYPELSDKVGQPIKVKYVVNSMSGDPFQWRGNILTHEAATLTAEQQAANITTAVKSSVKLEERYMETAEVSLSTSYAGFDKCTVAWSLKDGSTGAAIVDNKLTITPTNDLQTFTLVATVTVEGLADPVVVEYSAVDIKTTFDPVSHAEFVAADDGDKLFIQGVVTYNNKSKNAVYIQDSQGGGYYLNLYSYEYTDADLATGGKFALGKEIKVYGTRDTYNGLPQLNPLSVEGISDSTVPAPTDIAEIIKNDQINTIISNYVTIDVLYSGSTFYTIDGKEVAYYDQFKLNPNLTAGKVYNIVGVIGYYNNAQLQPITITEKTDGTVDSKFVWLYLYGIMGMGQTITTNTVVGVPQQLFGFNLTYSVNTGSTTVVYDNNQVTINPTVEETSTLSVSINEGTPFTIEIKTATADSQVLVTIADYATANSWTNSTKYTSLTVDPTTTVTVSGGSNTGKYYTSGNNWRLYENETPSLVITSTRTIAKVIIEYTVANTGVLLNGTTQVETGSEVIVNATTITFGVGNTGTVTNGNVRVSSIKVIYA